MASDMIDGIKHWWVFLLRGLGFIIVGIYMLTSPVTGYAALSFLFGAIIIIAGIAEIIHAYANRYIAGQVWRFFIGIIDLVLGIVLVTHLIVSMTLLPYILALWFLFRGISLFSFSGSIHRSSWLTIGGIACILFALLIIFDPAFGAMTILLWTALAFIITGMFNCLLAFKLKTTNELLSKR
jgi:uncharacterized membrane protein HdeD (DUF308 family)